MSGPYRERWSVLQNDFVYVDVTDDVDTEQEDQKEE